MPRYEITDGDTGRTLVVEGDSPPTEQESLDLFAAAKDGPGAGKIVAGIGTEVTAGVAGQAAGAALAPFTLGISYPVLSFAGGFGGSLAAQKVEGRTSPSWGRAVFAGMVNLIPGSSVAKGAVKASAEASKITGGVVARAAGKEALKGAALGAGEVSSAAVIDEKRLPNVGEISLGAGAGAVFGGALGALIKGGPSVWNKIAGKTEAEIDELVRAGEIRPVDLTPASPPELANIPHPLNAERRAMEDLALGAEATTNGRAAAAVVTSRPSDLLLRFREMKNMLAANVAPSRTIGREISDRIVQMRNEVKAFEELGSKIGTRVDEAINAAPDRGAARQAVEAFMNNGSDELPNELARLAPDLALAREKVGDLQRKLVNQIDVGVTPGGPQLSAVIAKSIQDGDYLTREYRFFTDTNYRPTPEARDKAMNALTAGYVTAGETLEVAKGKAQDILAGLDAKKLSAVRESNLYPSAIDGFLKERQQISPEVREYLGEITDTGERIRGTLARVSRGVERDAADASIKQMLAKNGLAVPQPQQAGMVELSLRRREPGGSQLYVTPDVQRALNILYLDGADRASTNIAREFLKDAWQSGVATSKAVKVLLNPPSYAVQVYGNAANLIGMGINPMSGAGQGLRLTLADYGPMERLVGGSPDARRKLLQDVNEMTRYGIKGANVLDSDLRSGLQTGIIGSTTQKALDPFSKAYTVPDTVGRFVAWKANQKTLARIFPQAGEKTLKGVAANITNDTYQNYERLSTLVRTMSQAGVMPQFASFTMEFMRNQYHQARIIREMMTGRFGEQFSGALGAPNVGAMRAEAAKRLTGLAVVYGGTFAGIKAWNASHGVDEEQYRAIKETIVPDWDEDRLLAMSLSEDGGQVKFANPSYIIPQALGLSVFDAAMSGKPISALASLVTEETVGEGTFVTGSLYASLSNTDPLTKRPISYEENDAKRANELAAYFFSDAFTPGGWRELEKLTRAMRGQGHLSVRDVAARQAGVRVNSADIQEAAKNTIARSVQNATGAKSRYTSAMNSNKFAPQELDAMYEEANRERLDALSAIQKHAGNLRTLGFDDDRVIATLKDAGLGTRDILNTLDGTIEPFPRVARITATDLWDEEISKLPQADQEKRIRGMAETNPALAQSLVAKMREAARAEQRGTTSFDDLVRSLGVADGTRAWYIYDRMGRSNDPDGILREFARKGLATPEVMRDIQVIRTMPDQSAPAKSPQYRDGQVYMDDSGNRRRYVGGQWTEP